MEEGHRTRLWWGSLEVGPDKDWLLSGLCLERNHKDGHSLGHGLSLLTRSSFQVPKAEVLQAGQSTALEVRYGSRAVVMSHSSEALRGRGLVWLFFA